MKGRSEKDEFIENFLKQASNRWGRPEVEEMKTSLRRTAEAAWKIRAVGLDPYEEPSGTVNSR